MATLPDILARLTGSSPGPSLAELSELGRDLALHEHGAPLGVARLLHAAVDALATANADPGAAAAAAARLVTAVLPLEPAEEDEMDAEIILEFIHESRQNLSLAEQALLALERDPGDAESIGTVFRAFHTVKGCAAVLELRELTELSHDTESLMVPVRDGQQPFDDRVAALALRSIDVLGQLLTALEQGRPREVPPALTALLHDLRRPVTKSAARAEAPAPPPPVDAAEPAPVAEHRTADDGFIRLRTQRLDRLVDLVGELVVVQTMVAQEIHGSATRTPELSKKLGHLEKLVRELQDAGLSLRMVPLRPTFQRMTRVVRDTARKSGRKATLVTVGDDTEIDRNLVDAIADPLVHMVRNAVDHGIEEPSARSASGKPESGTITLRAFHAGGSVIVELQDDGAGLDRAKLVKKALAKNLITSDAGMSDADVFGLIFEPGFSTKEAVTDISGRGVGMDVVRRAIQSVRGRIEIESQVGRGTLFRLRLPLTLAITDGMLVRVGSERFVVPTASIAMSTRPDVSAIMPVDHGARILMHRGRAIPFVPLGDLLGATGVNEVERGVTLIIGDPDGAYALLVDEIEGQRQVVAKPLGGMGVTPGVAGGAILGDGRVGLVVDPAALGRLVRAPREPLAEVA